MSDTRLRISDVPWNVRRSLKRAVRKGARRLDHRRPRWFLTIDTKLLKLSSGCNCVIGQLYGSWDHRFIRRVLNNLRITDEWGYYNAAERYGFSTTSVADEWLAEALPDDQYDPATVDQLEERERRSALVWHALDTYWKQEIRARRGMDATTKAARAVAA